MKYWIDPSGLFYFNKTIVSLVKKPRGVVDYHIYQRVDPPKMIQVKGKFYNFSEGEYLEVVTDKHERIFFQLRDKVFVRRTFKPVEILEGEMELGRHLGIYPYRKQD